MKYLKQIWCWLVVGHDWTYNQGKKGSEYGKRYCYNCEVVRSYPVNQGW